MPAKEIFGISGAIFVLASAVAMIAELTDTTASALRPTQYAAYGVSVALLLVAAALHGRRKDAVGAAPSHILAGKGAETTSRLTAAVIDDAPAQPVVVQGVPHQHIPARRSALKKVGK